EASPLTFNQTSEGHVVFTQEVLQSYLQLFTKIFAKLSAFKWFDEADCKAVLAVSRSALLFADAPLYSSDIVEMTRVQRQVLDIALLLLKDLAAERDKCGRNNRYVTLDTAISLIIGELAVFATAPFAIQIGCSLQDNTSNGDKDSSSPDIKLLYGYSIVKRTTAAFAWQIQRLKAYMTPDGSDAGDKKQRKKSHPKYSRAAVLPTLIAFAKQALNYLGSELCTNAQLFGQQQQQQQKDDVRAVLKVLEDGVWKDSIVAIGLHLAYRLKVDGEGVSKPSDSRLALDDDVNQAVGLFARAVPLGMLRLRDIVARSNESENGKIVDALAEAWEAVGIVLGSALGVPNA
ncbi:hypothetical protein GGI12_006277, partial [Dipsacomyces acuminosporus]